MTSLDEIQAQIERLEATFGPYNEDQIEIIIPCFKMLHVSEIENVVTEFIATSKFKPTPGAIREKAYERRKRKPAVQAPTPEGFVCQDCFNTGLEYGSIEGVTTLFQCTCQFGKSYGEYPRIELFKHAQKVPFKSLAPTAADLKTPNAMWEKANAWRQTQQTAKEFWTHYNKPQTTLVDQKTGFDSLLDD